MLPRSVDVFGFDNRGLSAQRQGLSFQQRVEGCYWVEVVRFSASCA